MLEENFVGILMMRGLGIFQWIKSGYIDYIFKLMNYEGVCVYVEIIIDFLDSVLIDKEEEKEYLDILYI